MSKGRKSVFMKQLSLLLLFAFAPGFFFCACREESRTEIPFVAYVDIPPGLGTILTYNFELKGIKGTSISNIIDAQPVAIRITAEVGELNMNMIRRAILNIESDSTILELGYVEEAPQNNSSTLDIFPSIAEVSPYIMADRFDMLLKLGFRYPTAEPTTLRIDFLVSATLSD